MSEHDGEASSLLRYGHVTEYDAARHCARVEFPELGIVSGWLPLLTRNTISNHDESHLDEGEHVACILSGSGTEAGAILGAFYDDKNPPPIANGDVRAITFDDGTVITYNRSEHKMQLDCAGDIEITAKGNIKITGSRIDLN